MSGNKYCFVFHISKNIIYKRKTLLLTLHNFSFNIYTKNEKFLNRKLRKSKNRLKAPVTNMSKKNNDLRWHMSYKHITFKILFKIKLTEKAYF